MKNMKNLWAVLAVVFAAGVLTGCNTIQGAGKDIERGGEKIQNKANETKQNM